MMDALHIITDLVRSKDWETLGATLAPEIRRLVIEWDALPSNAKGELTGYILGKHGTDFLAPTAIDKAVGRGLRGGSGSCCCC